MNNASYVRQELEKQILDGRFGPGDRLDITGLASAFGVSQTPVREAISALASAGIVEIRPHRSAVVTTISTGRIIALNEVMAELVPLSARLAARRMTNAERQSLAELHDAMGRTVEENASVEFTRQDVHFHRLIREGARNPELEGQLAMYQLRLAPYRNSLLYHPNTDLAGPHEEHRRIVTAILAGDGEAAALANGDHLLIHADQIADLVAIHENENERLSA